MDETFIVTEGTVTVQITQGKTIAEVGNVIHMPRLSIHGYKNNSDGVVKMAMIFNLGLGRKYFFRKMYHLLDKNPIDLLVFQKLHLKNYSYSLDEKDMIPVK